MEHKITGRKDGENGTYNNREKKLVKMKHKITRRKAG